MRPCPVTSGVDKRLALDNNMYAEVTPATYEQHLPGQSLGYHSLSLDDSAVTMLHQPGPSEEKTWGSLSMVM